MFVSSHASFRVPSEFAGLPNICSISARPFGVFMPISSWPKILSEQKIDLSHLNRTVGTLSLGWWRRGNRSKTVLSLPRRTNKPTRTALVEDLGEERLQSVSRVIADVKQSRVLDDIYSARSRSAYVGMGRRKV